ncbi:SKU5 similar 13 [Zea mays]|uniref:SKU5 similar 13 n=1 Tax=Zea mays TaxID=4577 RepID=A0A1D6G9B2_MAIZE|nr:SKU5 similar 13 [Zea mays]
MVWSAGMATMRGASAAALLVLALAAAVARAEDPYHFFEWKVTYGTRTIMGTAQKVILINDMFPGPTINCSSSPTPTSRTTAARSSACRCHRPTAPSRASTDRARCCTQLKESERGLFLAFPSLASLVCPLLVYSLSLFFFVRFRGIIPKNKKTKGLKTSSCMHA